MEDDLVKKHRAVRRMKFVPEIPLFVRDYHPEELRILKKYGAWLNALASGTLKPYTRAQRQFIEVISGEARPRSVYEKVWKKYMDKVAQCTLIAKETDSVPGNYELPPTRATETLRFTKSDIMKKVRLHKLTHEQLVTVLYYPKWDFSEEEQEEIRREMYAKAESAASALASAFVVHSDD